MISEIIYKAHELFEIESSKLPEITKTNLKQNFFSKHSIIFGPCEKLNFPTSYFHFNGLAWEQRNCGRRVKRGLSFSKILYFKK